MRKGKGLESSWLQGDHDLSANLGLIPPQELELEVAVLGGAILERQGQIIALEKLTPEDFYLETHREVFQAMVQLATAGSPIDMRTVVNQLRTTGKLELVGGAYIIAELTSKVSSSANIEYYCMILIQKRIARDIIQFAGHLTQKAYDDGTDVFKVMNEITAFPLAILDKMKAGTEVAIKDVVTKLAVDINNRQADAKPITGVPSGYESLDRLMLGWQPGALVIIAARPGMGKTTFLINLLRNAAIDFKVPVAIFSLEMTALELGIKFTSMETEMDNRKLTSQMFAPLEMDHFIHSTRKLVEAPIYIDDTPGISIMDLRVKCRRFVEKYKVKMIGVDYLQLMIGQAHTLKNREQEISSISRGLKLIAKELGIPVLALSQLSREVDKRPLPRLPILSDLRESGSLEQDADMVMFVWRPDYYKIQGDENGSYAQGLSKLIIAKHRNGAIGECYLAMIGRTSKFKALESAYLQTVAAAAHAANAAAVESTPKHQDDLPF